MKQNIIKTNFHQIALFLHIISINRVAPDCTAHLATHINIITGGDKSRTHTTHRQWPSMRFFALGTVGRTIFTFRFSSCRLVLWRRDSQRGIHTHSTGVHIPTHTHTSPHAGACEFGGAICPLYALRTEAGGLRIGWEGLVAADKSIKRARKCCYTPPLSTRLDCCCHTHTHTRTHKRARPLATPLRAHTSVPPACACAYVCDFCVCVYCLQQCSTLARRT